MSFNTERHNFWTLAWSVILLGVIATAAAFSFGEPTEIVAAYKRSAMDLAMMQVYRICDWDKNGIFTKIELQCVQKVLFILLTGR